MNNKIGYLIRPFYPVSEFYHFDLRIFLPKEQNLNTAFISNWPKWTVKILFSFLAPSVATLKSTEITGLTKNYRNFRLFGYTVCGDKFQGYNIFWFGTFLDMVCGITAPYWYEQKINIMQVLDLILSKTKLSHIFPICFIFS